MLIPLESTNVNAYHPMHINGLVVSHPQFAIKGTGKNSTNFDMGMRNRWRPRKRLSRMQMTVLRP